MSTKRERDLRRHRGKPKLKGYRPTVTGHPPLFATTATHELDRIAEGGGYPVGFIELAARLMGCQDLGAVVHLCSGSVRGRFTFDFRVESAAAVRADIRWLPIRDGGARWIMVDPPYGPDRDPRSLRRSEVYPSPAMILRECARALAPGGSLAFLHFLVPSMPADAGLSAADDPVRRHPLEPRALTIARRPAQGGLFP